MGTFSGGSADDQYIGTAQADQATGAGGDDALFGLGGNDTLDGGADDDVLDGGDDQDVVIGGAGADNVSGGNGDDTLFSRERDPAYFGYFGRGISYDTGAEADILNGGAGNDGIFAGYGDSVDGGANDAYGDKLFISFLGAPAGVTADFRLLSTQATISIGGASIGGIEEVAYLEGSNFDDLLAGWAGGYYPVGGSIYGRGGNDHIIAGYYSGWGGSGLFGGEGNDLIDLTGAGYGPSAYGEGGDDRIIGGNSYERLDGGDGNDTLEGNYGYDTLFGGGGNDIIDGGSFGDFLSGEGGSDTMYGAGDADELDGGDGDDLLYGDYSLISSAGALSPASNADILRGGAGNDVLHGDQGNDKIDGGADNDTAYGGAGNDALTGGSGNDRLEGGEGDDTFYGGDGSDTIVSGIGTDSVSGEGGDDLLFMLGTLTSADIVAGGDGVDTLILQGNYAGGLTLTPSVFQIENISILGGGNMNFGEPGTNRYDYSITLHDANFAAGVQARINGSALLAEEDFTFDGSAETDAKLVVYGGRGKDTLTGGQSFDIFFFAEGRFATGDTVNGGAGYDGMFLRGNYTIDFNAPGYTGLFTNIENLTLTSATDERYARGGGTEFDYNIVLSDAIVKPGETLTVSGTILLANETMVLDGSQESDGLLRLFGGKAADTLKGGGQSDLIHGSLGADILAGNGGSDSFRYQSVAESNGGSMDHILDFTPGTDSIDLSRVDADSVAAGNQAFSWIGSNAFSGTAGQLRAYEQGGTWFVEGDVDGDSVADLVISLTLQGQTPLSAGDFLL